MDSKEILRELININTICDNENEVIINYIEKYLKNIGFKTEYKSKCLVMSINEDINIGFMGHTDTVSYTSDWTMDPFKMLVKDGKIFGLGTSDMKGSIAVILSTVSKIDWSKTKKGIKLFFTYDEEIGFSGIKELIDKKIEFPRYMIIGEPTNNKIINASKGLLEVKLTFKGLASHSSTPNEGINAIEKCVDFINKLKENYRKIEQNTINSKSITMNIGVIKGGNSLNVVPNYCELSIDFRTIFDNQNQIIIDMINKIIKKEDIKLQIINNIKPFKNKLEDINMSDYISEASFIDSKNRYILGLGPINAHKSDEYVSIDSLKQLEKQYFELIKNKIL